MGSIDTNFNPLTPDVLRMEFRQIVGGNALDKPTAGQRFKMALAKAFSFFGGVGGLVSSFFGPMGMVASAGLYGLKRLSDGAIGRMQTKQAQQANLDQSTASLGNANFAAPGFNWNVDPGVSSSSQGPQVQWAPSSRGFEREIMSSLNARSNMTSNMVESGLSAGSEQRGM